MCGEKLETFFKDNWPKGSPPHVRGKAGLSHGCLVLVGITPAYAGKRVAVRSDLGTIRDHPRVCGEKRANPVYFGRLPGSPPRVRGKVLDTVIEHAFDGITPAYAGKSWCSSSSSGAQWDHPRMCGEKALKSWLMSGDVGSPPRVRGKGKSLRKNLE